MTLNEEVYPAADIPFEAELGTAADGPLGWDAEITETPKVGDVEIWTLVNLTVDAHPIHVHLVQFQVVERVPFDADAFHEAQREFLQERRKATRLIRMTLSTAIRRPGTLGNGLERHRDRLPCRADAHYRPV